MRESIRYACHVFLLTLRQLLHRRRAVIIVCLPLLLAALFRLLPPQETAAPVRVGIALRDGSGEAFQELLQTYGGAVVTFCPTDVETLEKNVALSRWDCGLIVEADFEDRLEELDTDRLITLVIGEGSAVYPLVREAAAASIAQLITPYIAETYLEEQEMDAAGELPHAERVDIQMEVLDGGALAVEQAAESLWSKLLLSALITAAAVYALLTAADLGRWLDGTAGRMERRLRGVTLCVFPRLLAMLCPAVLGVAAAAVFLRAAGMLAEVAGLLLAFGALGLLLCRRPMLWKPLPLVIPLICPAALIYALLPDRLPVWMWFSAAVLLTVLAALPDCRTVRRAET